MQSYHWQSLFQGMMVGWYLHTTKCKVRIPYWLVSVGWVGALAIIGSLIFGMVDGYFEVWPTAFYVSVGHTGNVLLLNAEYFFYCVDNVKKV